MSIELICAIATGVLGIGGMVCLFAVKAVETRQHKIFFGAARKKYDDMILNLIIKLGRKVEVWRSWQMPIVWPHATAAVRSAYAVTNRLIQNRPMRLTGVAYSKGYYATERVSKYLREVSKGKERGTISAQRTIEE